MGTYLTQLYTCSTSADTRPTNSRQAITISVATILTIVLQAKAYPRHIGTTKFPSGTYSTTATVGTLASILVSTRLSKLFWDTESSTGSTTAHSGGSRSLTITSYTFWMTATARSSLFSTSASIYCDHLLLTPLFTSIFYRYILGKTVISIGKTRKFMKFSI